MSTLVTILHVGVCLFLMVTVLLQSGKGGGMGAAFGAGGSQTVFGGSGAGNFLRRLTVACAAIFMITSITLAYLASSTGSDALRRFAEQERQRRETMDAVREQALTAGEEGTTPEEQPATTLEGTEGTATEGGDTTAPEGAAGGDTTAPEGAEGAAPAGEQPAGAAGADTAPAAGGAAEAPAGGTAPAAGAPATAPAGQGATPNP